MTRSLPSPAPLHKAALTWTCLLVLGATTLLATTPASAQSRRVQTQVIRGKVVDSRGRPADTVRVSAWPPHAVACTNARGEFSMTVPKLRGITHVLHVSRYGSPKKLVRAQPVASAAGVRFDSSSGRQPTTGQTIRLSGRPIRPLSVASRCRGYSMRRTSQAMTWGRVTDARTGRGLPGVRVTYVGKGATVRTNADGLYWMPLPRSAKSGDKLRFSSSRHKTHEQCPVVRTQTGTRMPGDATLTLGSPQQKTRGGCLGGAVRDRFHDSVRAVTTGRP